MFTCPWVKGFVKRLGIQGDFGVLFAVIFIVIGVALSIGGYRLLSQRFSADVQAHAEVIERNLRRDILSAIDPVKSFVAVSAHGPLGYARTLEERLRMLPVIQAILQGVPLANGFLIGYDNGDFLVVDRLDTAEDREYFKTPADCALAVRVVYGQPSSQAGEFFYYDKSLRLLAAGPDQLLAGYDPRLREWYKRALLTDEMVETGPFYMRNARRSGIIFSQKCRSGIAVLAMGLRVDHLSAMLTDKLPMPGAHLALIRDDGVTLASAQSQPLDVPGPPDEVPVRNFSSVVNIGIEQYLAGKRGYNIPVNVQGQDWLLFIDEIYSESEAKDGMILAIPRDELMARANSFLKYTFFGVAGCLAFFVPVVWLAGRRVANPLRAMAEQTFRPYETVNGAMRSGLEEIDALARGVDYMQGNQKKILAILRTIGSERDIAKLLDRVLQETVIMSESDGGGIILVDSNGEVTGKDRYYWVHDAEQEVRSSELKPSQFKSIVDRVLASKNAFLDSVPRSDFRAEYEALLPAMSRPEVVRVDIVWMALRDRTDKLLGLMALFRAAVSEKPSFSPDQVAFVETLAAAASLVLETQHLIKGQRDLRDAFIRIIAGAIDAKSPYTGGHCERVPVIFQMLLQEACNAQEGPLADFTLDEDGWEEARLAGWLHDCGKVTTPEYVMDKSTKLETLYDRIHEVRMRFEVLKRDAEIAYWRAVANGGDREAEKEKLAATLGELDDDFRFVASCNSGGERMTEEALARLAGIGLRVWTRTLDKRLGVSRAERERMDKVSVPPAPVVEPLLADNLEHIIPRGPKDRLPADNSWGFKVKEPDILYNRGELYNLSIREGTLTPEERYKINDHITQTIIMLESMPLPKELENMPKIAGAHHETMDGRGYPRRLVREEMSWGARMMAVADIFEALTACDRPYKSCKTLSEALRIMEAMRENQHIDPDVYELFLQADIPRRYAAQYLTPEQNDIDSDATSRCLLCEVSSMTG